jgi:hypothetical protein
MKLLFLLYINESCPDAVTSGVEGEVGKGTEYLKVRTLKHFLALLWIELENITVANYVIKFRCSRGYYYKESCYRFVSFGYIVAYLTTLRRLQR